MNALERGFDSRRESCGEAGVETAMIRLLVGTLLLLFVSNITAYWRNLPGNYRTYRGLRVSSSIGNNNNEEAAAPKKRGRPKKIITDADGNLIESESKVKSDASEKKRGRPRRIESDYDIQLAAEMLSNKGMAENKKPKYKISKKTPSPNDDIFSMSKLQEDFKEILPKLDEDFAKLEANLISDELDFEELLNFDGIDNDFDDKIEQLSIGGKGNLDKNGKKKIINEQDLDATLRSIESGSYSIDDLLNLDDAISADIENASRSGSGSGNRNKKGSKKSLSNDARDINSRLVDEDDEDDEDEEIVLDDSNNDDIDDGLLLNADPSLNRRRKRRNDEDEDLMIDVINLSKPGYEDEEDDDEDEEEEEEEEEETVAPKKRGRPAKAVVDKPLLSLDDIDLDKKDFSLDPPPLEEFKRLMESLGPDSMFADTTEQTSDEQSVYTEETEESENEKKPEPIIETTRDKAYLPQIYEGGKLSPRLTIDDLIRDYPEQSEEENEWDLKDVDDMIEEHSNQSPIRVKIVSVVTNSSTNNTALEIVNKVYDYIKAGVDNDERITYQVLCMNHHNDDPYEELDDMIQMWLESYNTYHLVDGKAMKEAWGNIMPHIMLSTKNLDAIVAQVKWALIEDSMNGALLSPRMRRIRFRGGAQEMITGYNTEFLESEFSVVSVR